MKKLSIKKRFTKEDKERSVLLGLVELYIKTGEAIGSNTLKESGFKHMSSATIRNYFSSLEKKGFLKQQHTSGGRTPSSKGLKAYVDSIKEEKKPLKSELETLKKNLVKEDKKITDYLNHSCEFLSDLTNSSIFQSSPRFDQDFINSVKLLILDKNRVLCVIVTDFGLIKTEILYSNQDLDEKMIKTVELFFLWRMNKIEKPKINNQPLMKLSQHLYNELMVRYIVGFANVNIDEIYKTGLSKLLNFKEFKDPSLLAEALSIFENTTQMNLILQDAISKNTLTYYIGDDLEKFGYSVKNVSIICIPYYISNIAVGAIAMLCPIRSNYKKLFSSLKAYSEILSDNLTKNVYKYKITFHQSKDEKTIKDKSILLDIKSK